MKNLKLFLILIVPILLMSSKCVDKNKNDADNFQTLKGRLMVDCNTPYASSLVQLGSTKFGIGGFAFCEDASGNTEFYTDENGYFEINYRKIGSSGTILTTGKVLESISLGEKSLDVGDIFLGGKVNFVIKLEVNNPYTANDTLIFRDFNGSTGFDEIRIPGPFQSGVVDSVINYNYIEYPLRYNEGPKVNISYFVRPYISGTGKHQDVSVPFCSNVFQEAVLIID